MEEFKREIDKMHAPDTLIEETIQRIHQEENREQTAEQGKNGAGRVRGKTAGMTGFRFAGVCIAAVCILVVIVLFAGQPSINYNELVSTVERDIAGNQVYEEIFVEEYESYLNVDLQSRLAGYELEKTEIKVLRDDGVITEDEGTFYLNDGANRIILKVSKLGNPAPEELLKGEASNVKGVTVYIGTSNLLNQYLAAFEAEGVNYYLICKDMTKGQFRKILKSVVRG